jgi:RNA polymerase sigma-70 factor (ECF subfamily)
MDHGTQAVTAIAEMLVDEASAFDDAIRPLMKPLLAYFVRRIVPTEDAADCLSETLVVLWRRRQSLPADEQDVRRWAYGIAKGVLANMRRGRVRHRALAERLRAEVVASVVPPDDGDVADALDHLNTQDRELVALIVWDGFGVAEAGALLGLKPDAARSRYSRARARLRERLG